MLYFKCHVINVRGFYVDFKLDSTCLAISKICFCIRDIKFKNKCKVVRILPLLIPSGTNFTSTDTYLGGAHTQLARKVNILLFCANSQSTFNDLLYINR